MTKLTLFFSTLSLLLVLTACKSDSKESLESAFGSFLASTDNVAVFGSVDASAILDKSDIKNFPKVGVLVKSVSTKVFGAFEQKSPIYMATVAKESEQAMYFFLKVKNRDSVSALFREYGYLVENGGDFDYMEEEDVTVGFNDHQAVLIVRNKKIDAKALLTTTFGSIAAGKTPTAKVAELIKEKGDIVFNTALGYGTFFGENGLTEATEGMKKLQEIAKDSYYSSAINFENGKMTLNITGFLTDALKERIPLKSTEIKNLSAKLGTGNARFGFSINADVDKFQSWMTDFFPEGKANTLDEWMDGIGMFIPGVDGSKYSNILAGDIAVLLCLEGESYSGGIPQINASVGFGSQGDKVAEAAASRAVLIGASKIGENTYSYEGGTYALTSKGVNGQTAAASGKLIMPNGSEKFGTSPLTAFLNLEGVNIASFGFENAAKVIEIVRYVKVEASAEKGKMEVVVKDPNQNILKQALLYFKNEIVSELDKKGL